MKSKTTEFLKNIGYSFLSFALPTIVLQLIIQPAIANKIGAELNGQYLTLMSFNFFLIGITASVLNTVRLLQNGLKRLFLLTWFCILLLVNCIYITTIYLYSID